MDASKSAVAAVGGDRAGACHVQGRDAL